MPIDPMMSLRVQQYEVPDVIGARMRRASALRQEQELADIAAQRQKRQRLDDTLRQAGPNLTPDGIAKIYEADPATGLELKKQYDANQNVLADNARADAEAQQKVREAQFAAVKELETANAQQVKASEEAKAKEQLAKIRQGAALVNELEADDIAGWREALEQMAQAGISDEEDAAAILKADGPTRAAYRKKIIAQALSMDEVGLRQALAPKTPKEEAKPAIVQEYEYAVKNGFKGDFNAYQNIDSNRRRPITNINTSNGVLDREIKQYGAPFQKVVTAADTQLEKIDEAAAMLKSGAVGQAVGQIKFLSALVSGTGSGVRITNAELDSIAHARGVKGNLQGWINNLRGDGKLTSEQVSQLDSILAGVRQKVSEKQEAANDVLNKMGTARSRDEIIQHEAEGRKRLSSPAGGLPTVTTKAQYDALPDGAEFIEDGKRMRKGK